MSDVKTYTSLFALVDSHLSKISLQGNQDNGVVKNPLPSPFQVPSLSGGSNDSSQPKLFTPSKILPIPKLGLSESPISSVLASQVANMLLAKEKRQEEERKKSYKEDSEKEDDSDFMIDLTQALQTPSSIKPSKKEADISRSSSCESLFKLQYMDYDEEPVKVKTPEPLLPCITDMSHLLHQKKRQVKVSALGKILSSRLRPSAPFYMPEKCNNHIKRFSFNTPSPCDVIKSKLRKPTVSCNYTINIEEI